MELQGIKWFQVLIDDFINCSFILNKNMTYEQPVSNYIVHIDHETLQFWEHN